MREETLSGCESVLTFPTGLAAYRISVLRVCDKLVRVSLTRKINDNCEQRKLAASSQPVGSFM